MATRRTDGGGPLLAAAPPATQTKEVHTGEAQRPTSSKLLIFREQDAVQTSPRIYLVLWGSTWAGETGDPSGVANRLHSFYLGLGGSKVAGVLKGLRRAASGAFTNPTGQSRGYIRDNSPVPSNPTVTDLMNVTRRAAAQVNDYSFNAQYVVAMPWGVVDQRTTQLRACTWRTVNTSLGWVT